MQIFEIDFAAKMYEQWGRVPAPVPSRVLQRRERLPVMIVANTYL